MRTISVFFLAVTALTLTPSTQAQFFRDDFDGRNPVDWVPMAPFKFGERNAINNDFVVIPPNEPSGIPGLPEGWNEADTMVDGRTFGDVSIRTQVSALEDKASWIGVLARTRFDSDGVSDAAIVAGVSDAGELFLGTFDDKQEGEEAIDTLTSTNLRPYQHDVRLQLDIFGDSANFWAWHADEAMPLEPLLIGELPDYIVDEGPIGIWSASILPAQTPVAYRFFEAAPVPEPPGLSLGLLGYLVLFALGRRKP